MGEIGKNGKTSRAQTKNGKMLKQKGPKIDANGKMVKITVDKMKNW